VVTAEGRVLLEVDPDVYGNVPNLLGEVTDRLNALHVASEVCWDDVKRVVHEQSGIAEDISLLPLCALNRSLPFEVR
jgi:hypothetical protein